MRERVAVIGTGIAGMATAYYLRKDFDVCMYEKNHYIGGHTNTINIESSGKSIPVDSGFMVFNEATYPNLVRLFDELGVTAYDTSMSFGVRNSDRGLEYACGGLSPFFAQRRNLFSLRHWKLYQDILSFFDAADKLLCDEPAADFSIANFASKYKISPAVMSDFLLPMAAAIWSSPQSDILSFSALSLIRFMKNHQMLGVGIQLQWKTVEGGSDQYKKKLIAQLPNAPMTNRSVRAIGEDSHSAYLYDEDGRRHNFDFIVIATHANQALRLLDRPNETQQGLLSQFSYNRNKVILHSDASVMPKERNAWASWNVLHGKGQDGCFRSSTHYWMNRLQNLDTNENLFVSVDYDGPISPETIHWQSVYEHPRFDAPAISTQPSLNKLNTGGRIRFCGSYFRNGFHEDALWSALNVVDSIKQQKGHTHEFMSL